MPFHRLHGTDLERLRAQAAPVYRRLQAPALPIDALEDLGEALLDFADMADLSAWLATHPRLRSPPGPLS
jgi:hypothetical protein